MHASRSTLTQAGEILKLYEVRNRDRSGLGNARLKRGALMIAVEALRFLAGRAAMYLLMAGLGNFHRS
jgi:hypothetical protein